MPHSIAFCNSENGRVCTRVYVHVVAAAHTSTPCFRGITTALLACLYTTHAFSFFSCANRFASGDGDEEHTPPSEREALVAECKDLQRQIRTLHPTGELTRAVAFGARD